MKSASDLWRLLPERGHAAELGVAEGRFSREMLEWPVQLERLYLVDRWRSLLKPRNAGPADSYYPQPWHDRNYLEMKLRTAGFGDRVVELRGDTVEMADRVPDSSLCFVFVDGDHSFEGVTRDIVAWLPKLQREGVMAFDDYLNPAYGVATAAERLLSGIAVVPEWAPGSSCAWVRVP